MESRKTYQGDILHIYNRSIAGFKIFSDLNNSQRFLNILGYYNNSYHPQSYSEMLKSEPDFFQENLLYEKENPLIKFISYSIMPDHYHLQVKILQDNILSKYISDVENSYSKYFNFKFKRKGPLWEGNYQFVRIKTNEQTLHVFRYIHLNATTSYLVERPEDWQFSSYRFYISHPKYLEYAKEISVRIPSHLKKFTEDQKDYQRKLKLIKKLILE